MPCAVPVMTAVDANGMYTNPLASVVTLETPSSVSVVTPNVATTMPGPVTE